MPAPGRALREPPRLEAGARVALISPSGPLRDERDLARGIENARAFGFEPVVGRHAMAREGYFAGNDAARVADLAWAVSAPDIDGIWCLRGGYGAARLLPRLEPSLVADRPKLLLGYSDVTALHAVWQSADVISFHGPTARANLSEFSRASLFATLQGRDGAGDMPQARTLRAGVARGRLAGGNLALVASLCGTPWALDFRGAIVVLEDINEASYRLDRMLLQLRLAGAFDGCTGLLLGQFTACPPESDDGERTVESVMQELVDAVGVPAVIGAPVGHVDDQFTLPLGAMATLDSASRRLTVHRTAHAG